MRWCTCTCSTSGEERAYKCPQTNALFPPRPFPSSPLPPLQPLSVVSDEPETAFPLIPNGKHATVPQQPDYYCDAEIARLGRDLKGRRRFLIPTATPDLPLRLRASKPEAAGFPFDANSVARYTKHRPFCFWRGTGDGQIARCPAPLVSRPHRPRHVPNSDPPALPLAELKYAPKPDTPGYNALQAAFHGRAANLFFLLAPPVRPDASSHREVRKDRGQVHRRFFFKRGRGAAGKDGQI